MLLDMLDAAVAVDTPLRQLAAFQHDALHYHVSMTSPFARPRLRHADILYQIAVFAAATLSLYATDAYAVCHYAYVFTISLAPPVIYFAQSQRALRYAVTMAARGVTIFSLRYAFTRARRYAAVAGYLRYAPMVLLLRRDDAMPTALVWLRFDD